MAQGRTCLFTSTPTARGVMFQMMPVLPWYHLCGMPACTALLILMST